MSLDPGVTPVLKARARGVVGASAWTIGGRLCARLIDLCTLFLLVRILSQADFGLIAMAMSVVQIGEAILELPLAQALIRVPQASAAMYATALTLGIVRGGIIAALMIAIAWPAALYFQEPRLMHLIWALAAAPVFRGIVSPRMVVFMRDYDFRREALLDVVGKSAALVVGVSTALATGSYWALAAGTIASPIAAVVLSYCLAPMRPRLTLREWPQFANMLGWNSVAQVVSALNWQTDRIVLGRFVAPAAFGRFSLADTLAALPFQALIDPLTRPLLVSFTAVSTPVERANAYLVAMGVISLVMAPIFAMLAIFATPVITLFLGENWMSAAPILSGIACVALLQFPMHPLPGLLMSQDRTKLLANRFLVEFVFRLPASIVGIIYFGIFGAIAGRAVGAIAAICYTAHLTSNVCDLSATTFVRRLARYVLPTAVASVAGIAVREFFVDGSGKLWAMTFVACGGTLFLCVYLLSLAIVGARTEQASAERSVLEFLRRLALRLARHRDPSNVATVEVVEGRER